jgi:hypothetical protein
MTDQVSTEPEPSMASILLEVMRVRMAALAAEVPIFVPRDAIRDARPPKRQSK